jgi:DNA anti-recombination protein RmuC
MTSRRHAWYGVVASLALVVFLPAGCQRERTTNEKQARLLAAQNVELRERVAQQEAEIEQMRRDHAEKLRQQDKLLAQCRARNEALQKDLQQGIAQRVDDVTSAVMNDNARLRREIEQLTAEVNTLKDKVEAKPGTRENP